MRKAFMCASVTMRLYIRSGRIIFPLLVLIGYPMVFYHVLPVDKCSSFSLSTVESFAWGAWVALSMTWSEDKTLRQILLVKAKRYFLMQNAWLMLFGAVGGIFIVALPMLAHILYLPDMFVQQPTAGETALAVLLNGCAGICGTTFGALFRPRCVCSRKIAYMICLLAGLMGLIDGAAGLPVAVRAVFPPIYDTIAGMSRTDTLTAQSVLPYVAWYLLYAAACGALQAAVLRRTEE